MTRLLLAAVLAVSLTGCGGGVNTAVGAVKGSPTAASTSSAAAVPAPPPAPRVSPSVASRLRKATPTKTAARSRDLVGTTARQAARLGGTGQRLSVTAYCPTGHRTASGVWPRPGMAAGNRWPFGTRLRVEGWGVVTVTDRIGHGSDLDIFHTSCAAARRFGRQSLRVSVIA